MPCLIARQIIIVEVPVEVCLTHLPEPAKQLALYLLQYVEPHERIGIVSVLGLVVFGHPAVQGALISQSLLL